MKLATKHPLALAGACLLTGFANAGINPTAVTTYLESAAATLNTQPAAVNSDPIRALTFDFTGSSDPAAYAAVKYSLRSRIKRDRLAISLRGPMTNLLSVEVIDQSNKKYFFPLTRTAQSVDDEGWSRHVVSLSALGNNTVAAVKLVVRPTPMNKKGTIYVRSVELLDVQVLPSTTDDYDVAPIKEASSTVVANLAPPAVYTGDHFRFLPYTFQSGIAPAVGFDFQLPANSFGTYVRFKTKTDPTALLHVRVLDKNSQEFVIPVDRGRSVSDAEGWTTHSVDLSKAGTPGNKVVQPLTSIRLAVGKAATTPASGVAYFKDVDLVNQNPSPYRPLHDAPYLTISSVSATACGTCVPGTVSSYAIPSDVIWRTQFNLAGTGKLHSGITLTLPVEQQFTGKVIRFLAKVPKGYFLETVLKDQNGQAHELRMTRPLSMVNEDGWVEYATKVELSHVSWPASSPASIGPSKEIRILLRTTGGEGVVFADAGVSQSAYFKGFRVDDSQHALDLRSGTQVAQAWKPVDGFPLLRTGVGVAGLNEQDFNEAQATELKWARVVVEWGSAEGPGGFDFTNFRNYRGRIAGLLSRGMNVVIILAYNNGLYSSNTKNGVVNVNNRDAFVRYAVATANMVNGLNHSGRRVVFEIWNEQNDAGTYWLGDTQMATHYGELLAQVAPAIKNTVNSSFEVISGGIAQPNAGSQFDLSYIKSLKNYLHVVDAIAYHPYEHNTPEFKGIETARIKDFLKAEGINKPLWITEAGTSSAMGNVDGTLLVNRQKQARVGMRHVLTSWGTDVPVHMIFTLRDYWADGEITGTPAYIPTYSEHNFGLLDRNHVEKPVRQGMSLLVASAAGRKLEGLVNGSESRIQAMKFSAADKETVYAVWSSYSTPGEAGYFTTPLNCDTSIDLKGQSSSGAMCVTDMVGTSIQDQCVAVEPSNPTTYRCPVSELQGPVFVRMRR